ncbi:MAG: hypothetical protein J2P25_23785, partial [Nocardiopsaceae bacterium]|nr:hypothetical protein [Nocardiopsaceae bacterium]
MPEKATISHRGARYEIGRGKRYYGIWAAGAPESDPVDRWPETPDGWAQAWTRFVSIEAPGTIAAVPRAGFTLPRIRLGGPRDGADGTGAAPSAAAVAVGLLGLGLVLGVVGLFLGYFGGQTIASQSSELVQHLLYFIGWAASAALIGAGARRGHAALTEGAATAGEGVPANRPDRMIRAGALLGAGVSVITFGMFLSDLGQAASGAGAPGAGAGMVLGIIGWAACAAGSA